MKLPVKFLAIDLDHTLIGFGMGTVSSNNTIAIQNLKLSGVEVVIVTGRSFERSLQYAKALKLNYHVCFGGSVIYDLKNNCFLRIAKFEKKTLQALQTLILNDPSLYAVFYVVQADGKIANFTLNQPNQGFFFHQINNQSFQTFTPTVFDQKVVRVNVFTNNLLGLENAFQQISFLSTVKVNQNYNSVLEITPIEGHKGAAVKSLIKDLNISQSQTAAIVDSLNDYPLIQFVRYSFAVANANQLIKRSCQYQTKSFDQDGVAFAIEKWLL